MHRRDLLAALPALVLSKSIAQTEGAALSPSGLPVRPYRQIIPEVAEDRGVVLVFFAFTCGFCRQWHASLRYWGSTLPEPLRFEFVPVVASRELMLAAAAWYAYAQTVGHDPEALDAFTERAYAQLQGRASRLGDPMFWREMAATPTFDEAFPMQKEAVAYAYERFTRYGIAGTPSMAIDGRFVITPDDANEGAFLQLANAVTSLALQS